MTAQLPIFDSRSFETASGWVPAWPAGDTEALDACWRTATCRRCGERRTSLSHDPCIANLPGVLYACCGHGCREASVTMPGRGVWKGEEAETRMRDLGGNPP